MNPKASAIYKETVQELTPIYGEREARLITEILFADLLKVSRTDRLTQPNLTLSKSDLALLAQAVERLKNHEPVQHVVGEAHFYNRVFSVNRHTLIPHPETEELVELIVRENPKPGLKILDVGMGTGCVAISLALELDNAKVFGIDISEETLKTALDNARRNGASLTFRKLDILKENIPWQGLDIVVSNPPYIPASEKSKMDRNVTEFDPEMALFVPDKDPLVFYCMIGEKGLKVLNPGGKLYFEIHEQFGPETADLLGELGYQQVSVFKDLQGKDRMVRAVKETSP